MRLLTATDLHAISRVIYEAEVAYFADQIRSFRVAQRTENVY